MKKLAIFSALTLMLAACVRNEQPNTVTENPLADPKVLVLPYNVDPDDKSTKIELKRNSSGDPSKLSATDMIEAINLKYPEIKLTMGRKSGDTLYVHIPDARYLSQTLGTTGSQIYFAEATYALTEIEGIKAVNFSLTEGDHAAPGVYTRSSFKGEVEVK